MKVTAVYFSPTGNSKKYALEVASRLSVEVTELDQTLPSARKEEHTFGPDELVIFSAPVYAGRIPEVEEGMFKNLKGNNTPAVFFVTFGNRAYEDAILELKNICEAQGFHGIGAGAFVGVHSFSDKLGADRPDKKDMEIIGRLADGIHAAFTDAERRSKELAVKGNFPYRNGMNLPFGPLPTEGCIKCGICAKKCPVGAIDLQDVAQVDFSKCLLCVRCVKNCPKQVRKVLAPPFPGMISKLEAGLAGFYAEADIMFNE